MKKALVVSHERSGTHFLINTIGCNFQAYDPDDISIHTKDGDPGGVWDQYRDYFGRWEKRIFKSHHQFEYFEPIWEDIAREWEVFYMLRDPRGALVSSWLYHKKTGVAAFPQCETFSEWVRTDPTKYSFDRMYSIDKSNDMIERWCKHVNRWLAVPEVRIVTYSELSNNWTQVVVDRLQWILEQETRPILHRPKLGVEKSIAPRCGIAGDWQNHVSEADNRFIIERLRVRLAPKIMSLLEIGAG